MIKKALIAAAALLALSAHAGYAQLAAPAGYASTAAGQTYAAAANDQVFGRVIHQPGALTANVGGQAVKMPAAYRLAANAPRVAAAVVFMLPGVRAAVGIAAWLGLASIVWDDVAKVWKTAGGDGSTVSDGYEYRATGAGSGWRTKAQDACNDWKVALNKTWSGSYTYSSSVPQADGTCKLTWRAVTGGQTGTEYQGYERRISDCQAGWYRTQGGLCTKTPQNQPLTQEQFEDALQRVPMPEKVPQELPYPTPLPIEQPSPWINPSPGENPQSQPLRVPTGTPVPIPNTNPQQYRQPYVDIVPAPTPDNPWRVDVKPGETISTNPNPVENPQPDSQDKPAEEDEKSLCDKYPDIAACEKVEVTDKPLPDQPKLYEPKYPDGITGVWNSKIQEIKATPLFNLASSLLPNVSAGTCPSWKVDLTIDGWTNGGLQDVSPPCWVWDVAKLVIIASALLLARRLIFGG